MSTDHRRAVKTSAPPSGGPTEPDRGERKAERRVLASRLTLGRIALIVGAVAIVWALAGVVMMIFFAVLLAASLRGAADWIAAHSFLPVGLAVGLVIIVVLVALSGLGFWTGPHLYQELQDLVLRLIAEVERLRDHFKGTPLMGSSGAGLQRLAERIGTPAAQVFTFSMTTLTELAVVVVTAIYFAASPAVYVDGVVRLAPVPQRARIRQVMQAVAHVLRMWLLGQLVDMVVVGVLSAAGLWLVGAPVPIALGVISGLFTFVPYLGTIVAGALSVLIAFSDSLSTALWTLGVFTLCHVVEGYVVAPLVQRRMVELPPALTVLSMTVLGSLFGLPGIILGTPAAAAGLVAVRMLYVGDVLGDHEAEPG